MLAEARRTLSSARAAVEAVAAVQGVQRGTLTVGIMQTPLFDLPGLIARYRRAYPGIELRIRQAGSTELGRLLGDRVRRDLQSRG